MRSCWSTLHIFENYPIGGNGNKFLLEENLNKSPKSHYLNSISDAIFLPVWGLTWEKHALFCFSGSVDESKEGAFFKTLTSRCSVEKEAPNVEVCLWAAYLSALKTRPLGGLCLTLCDTTLLRTGWLEIAGARWFSSGLLLILLPSIPCKPGTFDLLGEIICFNGMGLMALPLVATAEVFFVKTFLLGTLGAVGIVVLNRSFKGNGARVTSAWEQF